MAQPVALAHEAIQDVVEDLLRTSSRGRLLDVSANEGEFGVRLRSLGFEVS